MTRDNRFLFQRLKNILDRNSPLPLYHQIEKALEEMVSKGEILPGSRIPGDQELAELLGVNHRTVREAYRRLVEKGIIERRKKRGTFVREKVPSQHSNVGFFYFREAEIRMLHRAEYMQEYLSSHRFDLKLIGFDKDFYKEKNLWEEIVRRELKGAILVTMGDEACREALRDLEKRGFPHVRFANPFFLGELHSPLIKGDNRKAIREALEYLWELGHRCIGYIPASPEGESIEEYLKFYEGRGEMEERWIMVIPFLGPPSQWIRYSGIHLARGYLENNPEVTAILFDSPAPISDFLRQAELIGRTVPEKLSLLSLADWEGLEFIHPRITAMHLNNRKMGRIAAEKLLEVMEKGLPPEEEVIKVEYKLIIRNSTSPPEERREKGKIALF